MNLPSQAVTVTEHKTATETRSILANPNKLLAMMEAALTRDDDRALFGLPKDPQQKEL